MKCKKIQNQFTEYLDNSLSEVANSEIKEHLKSCSNCAKELEEIKSFLMVLDNKEIEVPSNNLRANFEKMLAQEIDANKTKVVQLQPKQDWKSYLRIAASIVIVIGAFLFGKHQSNFSKIASKKEENKQEILALLEDNSASKRILAASNTKQFNNKDTKIIDALINRLLFDKNANVRSASAEALSKFSKNRIVRDALIKALITDKNTSVQIDLIEILSKIQEKRAKIPMEKILENEETPEFIKQEIKINLPNLL